MVDNLNLNLSNYSNINDISDEFCNTECPVTTNDDARKYVAGYICRKLNLRRDLSKKDKSSWIYLKGEGRLLEPTSELIDLIKSCDKVFSQYHGNTIQVGKHPLKKVQNLILSTHKNFDPKVVQLYCKVRFFSRVKDFNKSLKINKKAMNVRNFKQTSQFVN